MVEGLKFGASLSDVTVASEDGYKAHLHKLILASASLYFYHLFEVVSESKHPVLILSGVGSDVLEMLISYMYCGFVDVPLEKLSDLVAAGKSLKIKVCSGNITLAGFDHTTTRWQTIPLDHTARSNKV
jgi:kelch-like protein 2/3